jgi:uncharacterized repeat protein (TIGR01451 family)
MAVKRFTTLVLAFGLLGLGTTARAQNDAGQEKQDKTLLERIDDFGKTIFGGILPSDKPKVKKQSPKSESRPALRKPAPVDLSEEIDTSPRAGSILSGTGRTSKPSRAEAPSRVKLDYGLEENLPIVPRTDSPVAKPVRRQPIDQPVDDVLPDETPLAEAPSKQVPASSRRPAAANKSITSTGAPEISKPGTRPLHERLSGFRESVFGSGGQRDPGPQPNFQPGRDSDSTSAKPPKTPVIAVPKLAVRPSVAQRTDPDSASDAQAPADPVLEPAAKSPAPAEAKPEPDGVLFARKGPILSVETTGPRKIAVGKESAYEVSILNSGEVAAEDLVVFVSLPEWAEVAGAEPTVGSAQATAVDAGSGAVQWKVGQMNARGRERLVLRIVPRQSRPFDLAVRWEYKPVASQAMIEVQEPKLSLQLEGPREVLYGKKESYRLKLANGGTGNAENVVVMLMPVGAGENVPASHKLGVLAAGEEKTLDVELTARQAGNLTIQVEARADGGVRAEMAEKVLVRRAGLKVEVEGPKVQFVGLPATYVVRVRNPGNAAAKNVRLSVALPAGAKYLSGVENAQLDSTGAKLQWTVETIGPEVEQSFAIKCSLGTSGTNRLEVSIAADDDLNTVAAATTRVDAVADLMMDVKDPNGPTAVGDEATYEVRVRNRGTKEAENVEVLAYFSRGIEPTTVEGAPNRILPGRVVFQPIASVAPGAEVVLKVRARAEVAGNHVFRVEVHCKPLGARLISEATNLYYADGPAAEQVARELPPGGTVHEPMRPVTRPVQGELRPASPPK